MKNFSNENFHTKCFWKGFFSRKKEKETEKEREREREKDQIVYFCFKDKKK
jgi:hypothetical protein